MLSRKLHASHLAKEIMGYGLSIISAAAAIFSLIAIVHCLFWELPPCIMVAVTILSQMAIAFGICIATSNALTLALVDYKHSIGTASSLFGFFITV
jgi:hypothetical protein